MSRPLFCLTALLSATVVLAPAAALACGGFYAQDIEVAPDQQIVLVHRAGVETYTFRPHFCGAAKDFGVILPVPTTLTATPALADNTLYDKLSTFTEPETQEVCESPSVGCGGAALKAEGDNGGGADAGASINVIDRGRVGQFDWVQLQAATEKAFTDWLDQNGFPHGASDAYQYYVTKGWYFVAFKVSADTALPPTGKKLCGDLGPIQLSFSTVNPVIPARIVSVNTGSGSAPKWRVYLVGAAQQQLSANSASSTLYFSKSLQSADVSAVGNIGQTGERLTVLDVTFPVGYAPEDLAFDDNPNPADHREVKTVYKQCSGGCSVTGAVSMDLLAAVGLLGLLGAARRVSRRRD